MRWPKIDDDGDDDGDDDDDDGYDGGDDDGDEDHLKVYILLEIPPTLIHFQYFPR